MNKGTIVVEYNSVRLRRISGIGKVVTDINPQKVSGELGIGVAYFLLET